MSSQFCVARIFYLILLIFILYFCAILLDYRQNARDNQEHVSKL